MFLQLLEDKSPFLKTQTGGQFLLSQIDSYTSSLRSKLSSQIDLRLVRTFFDLFLAILINRNPSMGLLLSELGGYICGFAHAPAGTKRISNLLRSKKWLASLIHDHFFDHVVF